jgi:hypothetical protein
MSVKINFDWEHLSWPDFQKLCLHLGQNIFKGVNFDEYLKAGNAQEGIDIISVQQPEGKAITIQCKKEKKITIGNVQKIIQEFEKGYYATHSSIFILATSASLDKKTVDYLNTQKLRLRQQLQVELQHWDRSFFEEQLKHHYTLVAAFFNAQTADAHCFTPFTIPVDQKPTEIEDFIERRVIPFRSGLKPDQHWYYYRNTETTTLATLFNEERLKTRHFCLVADAYQGKSMLLKQTAWQLTKVKLPFTPLFVECKYLVSQSIQQVLNEVFGQWKTIPAKDLIIFIDGLDEIPSNKFQEMLTHINSFAKAMPYVSLIFSCRRIFYEQYEIGKYLEHFDIYELHPLSTEDIYNYIEIKLPANHKKFDKFIHGAGLSNFLYYPFFLTSLVQTFDDNPRRMPNSKAKILEQFIERSLDRQRTRNIKGGMPLKEKIVLYKSTIQRLALTLQLSGLNSITNEQLQLLFSTDEVELLKHNTLLTKHNDQWSFSNALFQEHLAALGLVNMPYEKIISLVSVGRRIKKIKTKWIETTSSLLSLLDKTQETYQKLLVFVENDNIELLFTTERSKFDSSQRLSLLQKLIEKCTAKKIRPILIYEEKIAGFIDGDERAIKLLIEVLFDEQSPFVVKRTVCRILLYLNNLLGQRQNYFDQATTFLSRTDNILLACQVIEVLSEFDLGDRSTVELLVSFSEFCEHHSYRSAVYQYIIVKKLVDDYYQFGLSGIKYLTLDNRKTHDIGSETWFDSFLVNTNKSSLLKNLIVSLSNQEWIEYLEKHSIHKQHLLKLVIGKAIQLQEKDPFIIFAVIDLTSSLGRKYLRDEYTAIDAYFMGTNTFDLAVRIAIKDLLSQDGWKLATLIREESFDYLMWEWDQLQQTDTKNLRIWLGGLRHKNSTASNKLYKLLQDMTEGTLYGKEDLEETNFAKSEKQRRINDFIYIKSQKDLKIGIEKFFKAYGKQQIEEQDIYVHFDGSIKRINADSNFVYRLLLFWRNEDGMAQLSDALNFIKNNTNFEKFRAKEIFEYQFNNVPEEQMLLDILGNFFLEHLKFLDFTNCLKEDNYESLHAFIGHIFNKFGFDAPASELMELIWTDTDGIRSIEHNELNKKTSLSQKIIAKLNKPELAVFKQKVISNLRTGIMQTGVLGNHLRLCRHLKIDEAVEIIHELLTEGKSLDVNKGDMLNIYLELGGALENLLDYFKTMTDYGYEYFHFVGKFVDYFPAEVHASIEKCFYSANLPPNNKVKAAQFLCCLGDIAGFEYLVNRMETEKVSPYSIQSYNNISALVTSKALNCLAGKHHLLVEPDKAKHFSDSPKNLMIEWLQIFAMKGEDDLYQVIQYYDIAYENLKTKHSNAENLLWYEEQVIEKFRGSDKTVYSIKKVKEILDTIPD